MPSSPTKPQRSVLFKVVIPNRVDKVKQTSNNVCQHSEKESSKKESSENLIQNNHHNAAVQNSVKRCVTKTFTESDEVNSNAMYHENRKTDLRYKLQSAHRSDRTVQHLNENSLGNKGRIDTDCVESVLETLKKSSHGQVLYNRQHALSEEELPPVNQLSSVSHRREVVDRVCTKSPEKKKITKLRGRVRVSSPKEDIHEISAMKPKDINTGLDMDHSFSRYLNQSLAVIESMEFLNDSMSLLQIEQKNKQAGADYIEREKKKQDDFFKRSAQLSQDSYEQWSEKSRAKIQQQVKELRERKSQKDSSIESEYRKQQQYFQKKFQEDQANIKRVEVEEEAEKQRQIRVSWNNISNYEVSTLEIVTVAQKCVPDPKVDPEIEGLLSIIDKQSKEIASLKASANKLYKEGELGIQTAAKYEQQMGVVYSAVIVAVRHLNTAIKRVNEAQVARMVQQSQKEEAERKNAAKTELEKKEEEPVPAQPQTPVVAVQRQTSTESVARGRRTRMLSSEVIVHVNIVSSSAFIEYRKLDKQLKELQTSIEKFVVEKDKDYAKMRSALKLITVTPINSISASSNEHMANKVKELVHILEGKETKRGDKIINPGLNRLTLNYCFNIAASKFVDQACEQVAFSDNLVPAFSIAAVITGIWQRHATFGDLFLAHLYKRCPYTIPANWNKKSGESNEDYLRRLGYSADGDKIEDTDKFLQKMEGCIKLYAAVIQSPPSFPSMGHPHGLAHGWLWLSRMLNLEPVPDITATALEAFLKVAGSALHQTYKGQFLKLLEFLYSSYLPKLEAVTLQSNLGPITRLKLYLEKIKRSKSVPGPDGRISQSICK